MTEGRGERVTGTPDVTIYDPDDVIGGVAGGGSSERATGTSNTIYDLSSVLFHALEGGASYDQYVQDAEDADDQELADFFVQVRDEDSMRADEAQRLLAERTSTARGGQETALGVAAMEVSDPDLPPSTESRAEGAPSGDARREYAVTEMPDEDLTPPGEGNPFSGSREEAASPRPEPSDDFPGTEPVRGEDPTARSGEVPSLPEEIPPERAGQIPTAEEMPPLRTEGVPGAEEMPSGTPPQALPGDVQRGHSSEPLSRTEETAGEQERQIEREREDDQSLVERLTDRAREELTGEEEQRTNR
jgi:hypothetical protein